MGFAPLHCPVAVPIVGKSGPMLSNGVAIRSFAAKEVTVAKLGRRERLEKRKRIEVMRQLAVVRKAAADDDRASRRLLPKREYNLLKSGRSNSVSMGLSRDNLLGHTHYAGAYVGRSPGAMPPVRKPMPERFLTNFMAPGHEANATSVRTDSIDMKERYIDAKGKIKSRWRIVSEQTGHSEVNEYTRASQRFLLDAEFHEKAAKRDPLGKYLFRE